MRFAYGTNGFTNHRLEDALAVISDHGYEGVALTLDHAHLDPFAPRLPRRTAHVAARLGQLGLAVVVETGARYLLDPRRKHEPTLLSDDGADRRVAFLGAAVDIASDLGAEAVSFWSGTRPPHLTRATAWERLLSGCSRVLEHAERRGVMLGFEPEPGMLVEDLDGYDRLHSSLGHPAGFGLTLDIGHCHCNEPLPVPDCVRRAGHRLVNVQIDDMRRGVHAHLEFGDGEIDFPPVMSALAEVGYHGLVAVELPRHSHAAPAVAQRAIAFLGAASNPGTTASGAGRAGTTASDAGRAGTPASGAGRAGEAGGPGGVGRCPGAGRMTSDEVRAVLFARLAPDGERWLLESCAAVAADPSTLAGRFPAVGRRCGRRPLDWDGPGLGGWTVEDAARTLLLAALPLRGSGLAAEVAQTYRFGDAAEKRGVLRALPVLDVDDEALPLVRDALRSNDTRLIAAALGPYAGERLDDAAWRGGVLKCVFVGVPLAAVAGLTRRADNELVRMFADFARELQAAGRKVPEDVFLVLDPKETRCASSIRTST